MDAPGWRMLSASARCLYMILKRRDVGSRAGVSVSHREAAEELNFSRPTVAKCYKELASHGFIVLVSVSEDGRQHWKLTDGRFRVTSSAR
jgi:Mn-dependent DtxR family transcriptional regulator